jgi:hypothetical protein
MAAAIGDHELAAKLLDVDPESIRMRVNEEWFPKKNPRSGGSIYIWTLGMNKSAHQVARKFGNEELLRILMDRSPDDVRLVNAFALGDEAAVQAVLSRRPDLIQSLPAADLRQICRSAQDNDVNAVRLMLKYGWPPDGGSGETPLHWAAFHGNAEMVRDMLRHDPPLERLDPNHHATPLNWAIYGSENGWFCGVGKYCEVVEALLDAGAKRAAWTGGSAAVREVLRRRGSEAGA